MAPARMVSFMEQHAESCDICLKDPDLKEEIAKITEMVLPESKIPKAVRQQKSKLKEQEAEEAEEAEEQEDTTEEETTVDDLEEDEEEALNIDNDESGSTKVE